MDYKREAEDLFELMEAHSEDVLSDCEHIPEGDVFGSLDEEKEEFEDENVKNEKEREKEAN